MAKKKLLKKYLNGGTSGSTPPPVDPVSAAMFVGSTFQQMEEIKQRNLEYKNNVKNFESLKYSDPTAYYEQAIEKGNNATFGDPQSLIYKARKKELEFGRDLQYAKEYGASGFAPYETSAQKSLFKLGGYYKDGGNPEYATAEVEGNEHAVDPNGTGIQFEGPNHENGGIPVNLEPGTKVFSKRLKDTNGKSFAKNADILSKKLTKATKKLDEFPNSEAIENSIAILETQRDEVFNRQEDMKAVKAIKQTKKLMKNGGLVKYFTGGKNPMLDPDYLDESYIDYQEIEEETPISITKSMPAGTPVKPTETPQSSFDYNKVLPYAGALANVFMKNPKTPTYKQLPKTFIDKSAVNMVPTKFDINPQLEKAQADVRALEESVSKNISSGSNRFASSLAAKIAGMRNRNELYGQKFNVENQGKMTKAQMLNQINLSQAGMDMNTNQFNVGLSNQQLDNEYNRIVNNRGLTRQGIIDAATVKQMQDRDAAMTEADIQKVRIIAQRYGSGVLKRMFDKMVADGQMSQEQADAYLGLVK